MHKHVYTVYTRTVHIHIHLRMCVWGRGLIFNGLISLQILMIIIILYHYCYFSVVPYLFIFLFDLDEEMTGFTMNYFHRLIGTPRLRQQRHKRSRYIDFKIFFKFLKYLFS